MVLPATEPASGGCCVATYFRAPTERTLSVECGLLSDATLVDRYKEKSGCDARDGGSRTVVSSLGGGLPASGWVRCLDHSRALHCRDLAASRFSRHVAATSMTMGRVFNQDSEVYLCPVLIEGDEIE